MKIPVRNPYYLFTYAWGRLPAGNQVEVGVEDCPDLKNLLARILIKSGKQLLRRGIDRGYVSVEEEMRAPRGRMLVDQVIKRQTLLRGTLLCAYDELTPDVLHNRIIKAAANVLSSAAGIESSARHELGLLTRRMSGVLDVPLRSDLFRRVQLSRNTRQYGPLIRLCELICKALMPKEEGNTSGFADILHDDVIMSAVYEDFLRNFYALEQGYYRVGREVLSWGAEPLDGSSMAFVPTLETDITLVSTDRVLVFDAKYYRQALAQRSGLDRIRSGHLYQLSAYLQRTAARYPGRSVHGALIYPEVNQPLQLRYRLGEHNIMIRTTNLARPWREIHDDLLNLPAELCARDQVTQPSAVAA